MKTSKEQTEKTIDSVEKMLNCGYINKVSYNILKYELGVLMQCILVEEKNNTTKTDALKRISNAHSETWSAQIARDAIDETTDLNLVLGECGLVMSKDETEIMTTSSNIKVMTKVDDQWEWNKIQQDIFKSLDMEQKNRVYLYRTLIPQRID